MRSILLGLLAGFFVLQGCSVSKAARDQRNLMSGTWDLTDITYENNSGAFQAKLFNDSDAICFEGSEWFFRDNNSTGRYTINQGSLCQGGDRYFRWSIQDRAENYKPVFQFKFIDVNRKDISGGIGYSLVVESLSASQMKLTSGAQVDGAPITIVYHFTKK